jgi:hypothetical protein
VLTLTTGVGGFVDFVKQKIEVITQCNNWWVKQGGEILWNFNENQFVERVWSPVDFFGG